jgi:hypothetical protein
MAAAPRQRGEQPRPRPQGTGDEADENEERTWGGGLLHRPRSAPGLALIPHGWPDGVKRPPLFLFSNCSVRCEEIVKAGGDMEGCCGCRLGTPGGRGQVALRAADRWGPSARAHGFRLGSEPSPAGYSSIVYISVSIANSLFYIFSSNWYSRLIDR